MNTITIPIHEGEMRGRNRYSSLAIISVDAWSKADQAPTVRIEARSGRQSELAPAWLEMPPDCARDVGLALIAAAASVMGDDAAIGLTLTGWEVGNLAAWLDVQEAEHCDGWDDDDEHDADGHTLPDSGHSGYCPGDVADLDRISAKLMTASREAGW